MHRHNANVIIFPSFSLPLHLTQQNLFVFIYGTQREKAPISWFTLLSFTVGRAKARARRWERNAAASCPPSGTQLLKASLLPPAFALAGSWSQEPEWGIECRHSNGARRYLSHQAEVLHQKRKKKKKSIHNLAMQRKLTTQTLLTCLHPVTQHSMIIFRLFSALSSVAHTLPI